MAQSQNNNFRVSTDIGGTFTDLCYLNTKTGEIDISKSSTTPHDYSEGILDTIRLAKNLNPKDIDFFVHGSTIIINKLTEKKGAKVALITTKGFRDVLEIGRGNRPDLYNLNYKKPQPFVERFLRFEVEERINKDGNVQKDICEEEVKKLIEKIKSSQNKYQVQIESIAVCFLHSYANPINEIKIGQILKKYLPEIPFTLSYQITSEWREYERTNTAVFNSFVLPVSKSYVNNLEEKLSKITQKQDFAFHIMQSSGGTIIHKKFQETPIFCVESGPVAGVIGAAILLKKYCNEDNVITLDIGGTTVKSSLIEDGTPNIITNYQIKDSDNTIRAAQYPIAVTCVDIVEIGSGGGSIAYVDEAKTSLKVGPQSQGAYPGPACYNQGGDKATVTDANLVCGRLNPDYFLGSNLKLHSESSAKVIDNLRKEYNEKLSVEEMADGIIRIAESHMNTAIKLVSVRRGYDPSKFTVCAFGGGGSLHAGQLLNTLKVKKIIVPPYSGVFSALGMIWADLRRDAIKTYIISISDIKIATFNQIFQQIEQDISTEIKNEEIDADFSKLSFYRYVDMRYLGQEHSVKVPIQNGLITEEQINQIKTQFHELHHKKFTFSLVDTDIEIVNFHITAFIQREVALQQVKIEERNMNKALKGTRQVYFSEFKKKVETKIYERKFLPIDEFIYGPAIVEEETSTTLLLNGQKLKMDKYGFLHLELAQKETQLQMSTIIDDFTVGIIQENLRSISDEMFITMQKTSMSPIIYEVLDFAVGITDAKGDLISQGNGVAFFIGCLSFSVKGVLNKYKADQICEGDLFLVNNPYSDGGTHLCDNLIGFAINKAHWTEVGGTNPGSWSTSTTECYQEGLLFPCIKIQDQGRINQSIIEIIKENVRTPDMTIADLNSQIGSCKTAAKRFVEMCNNYGVDVVLKAAQKIIDDGEKIVRMELAKLPKLKNVKITDFIDDDGLGNGPLQVCCEVNITDEEFICDFTGSCDQVKGPINCSYECLVCAVRAIFVAITNIELNANEGCFRQLKVICPPQSIFSAKKPAPVATYWETMIFGGDLVWQAVAKYMPEKVTAGHFTSVCAIILSGTNPINQKLWILVEPNAGGWGAGQEKDGENGLVCIGDGETYIIPIEVAEQRYCVQVNQFALDIPEDITSGAGEMRGGRGLVREYEVLSDDTQLTATFGRNQYAPWAIGEGKQGSVNYVKVIYKDEQKKSEVFGKCANKKLMKGDKVLLYSGSGGGFGNPLGRSVDKIINDVKNEFISFQAAKEIYGCEINENNFQLVKKTQQRIDFEKQLQLKVNKNELTQ